MKPLCSLLLLTAFLALLCISSCTKPDKIQLHRIIVSTDIGGTDFDDYQSMVHLLLYADTFDIEGIISSPFGEGRAKHILEAIDAYEKDYLNLIKYSSRYPTADSLRKIVKQGGKNLPGLNGIIESTEGSEWIIKCARKNDPRPLNILIWGGIEDLARALYDAPDILPKLRVFYIGGPNKKWSVNAYNYIVKNFPNLWIIESNATYRGWFTGGNQSGEWSNKGFVEKYIKGFGSLGYYFYQKGPEMKMGDSPSLTYLLHGNPEDPSKPGWGGQYVRAWDRPYKIFDRITTEKDSIEEYGVIEFLLQVNTDTISSPFAMMSIENQALNAQIQNDTVRFLFSPKKAATWTYTITSNISSINNNSGKLVSYLTPASNKNNPSPKYANWWVDDPSPEFVENGMIGVKTVNRWRLDFLKDFAVRMKRCENSSN